MRLLDCRSTFGFDKRERKKIHIQKKSYRWLGVLAKKDEKNAKSKKWIAPKSVNRMKHTYNSLKTTETR